MASLCDDGVATTLTASLTVVGRFGCSDTASSYNDSLVVFIGVDGTDAFCLVNVPFTVLAVDDAVDRPLLDSAISRSLSSSTISCLIFTCFERVDRVVNGTLARVFFSFGFGGAAGGGILCSSSSSSNSIKSVGG